MESVSENEIEIKIDSERESVCEIDGYRECKK